MVMYRYPVSSESRGNLFSHTNNSVIFTISEFILTGRPIHLADGDQNNIQLFPLKLVS